MILMGNKYHRGLFVGRFQPFHKGHLFVLKKAFPKIEKLVIGVGSANKSDFDNPLDFSTRKVIIEEVIEKEGWKDWIEKIVPLDDCKSDDLWLENTRKKVGQIDVVVGNNDWVNNLFKKVGILSFRTEFFYRNALEGKNLRSRIRKHQKWDNLVPEYLFGQLTNCLETGYSEKR